MDSGPGHVRRLQGRGIAQEADQPARQNYQPPQERLHGHQPARGHKGHQAGPFHGLAALYGRMTPWPAELPANPAAALCRV